MATISTPAKLLTFGCSYSDENYISATAKDPNLKDTLIGKDGQHMEPFPFWPTLLADQLDMELENYAQMGIGNDGIHSIFEDTIVKADSVGLVVIMWTEVMRLSFEQFKKTGVFSTKNEWFKMKVGAGSKNDEFRKHQLELEQVLNKNGLVNPAALLRRSLRLFYSAQCICEYMGVPYIMAMGMPPSKAEYQDKIAKELIKSPYMGMMKNFMGWPLFEPLNGFCCADKINGEFINEDNIHPNEIGQQYISELIIDEVSL